MNEVNGEKLEVHRTVYNQKSFDETFLVKENYRRKSLMSSKIRHLARTYNPANLIKIFTFLNVISEYKFKINLVADLFSGLTVGIMQIPQVWILFLVLSKSSS